MTKKDYLILANIVNCFQVSTVNNKQIELGHVLNLMDTFCYQLKKDNPQFDDKKFKKACGVDENESTRHRIIK